MSDTKKKSDEIGEKIILRAVKEVENEYSKALLELEKLTSLESK